MLLYLDWKFVGVVVVIVFWNFLLMLFCWKVCSVFVMGNIVVFKLVIYIRLIVFLFVEICVEAGFLFGVFNVVIGNGVFGSFFVVYSDVDKVVFIGFIEVLIIIFI